MRCVIVGCGRAGLRLAQVLSTQGNQVTVVDEDAQALARAEALAGMMAGGPVQTVRTVRLWL